MVKPAVPGEICCALVAVGAFLFMGLLASAQVLAQGARVQATSEYATVEKTVVEKTMVEKAMVEKTTISRKGMSESFAQGASEFPLWANRPPGARGEGSEDRPTLTPYLSTPIKATGAAMIVCPGGGYTRLAPHEAGPPAEWLNSLGIKAFVLKYRLGSNGYRHPSMLQDANRAVRYVRSHASELGIDPNRIGILGFSAGGHVASSAGTHFDIGDPTATDPVERVSSRPDLMVLIYPVITMGEFAHKGSRENLLGKEPAPELIELMSNEKQVTKQTSPAFLVHSLNDNVVPVENSLRLADELRKAGVGFELHIFEKGPGHGFGMGASDPVVRVWPKLCEQWLRGHGF